MKQLFLLSAVLLFLSGCINIHRTTREPNTLVELEKKDFTFSPQVTGQSRVVQIFGIDFQRLFMKKTQSVNKDGFGGGVLGVNLASIPVVGNVFMNKPAAYALYDMMEKNPGYDVVFYPQYETVFRRPLGLGLFYRITEVKVTARLAKLN